MKKKKTNIISQNNPDHTYLKVFFLAFITFAVIIIPMVIYNKGYITFFGDFNSQQLPFYYHAHEAVKSGNILWDWGTDLGSSFIGSYSFYLLGSPFFWLTVLFPTKCVLYFIPWLLCLKYATAALTAYAYIRRFVKYNTSAVIGGFLYAFSGFQAYNIFFNHFHDVTAFFPLMLIGLEENVTNNRRGLFAVTVGLMATINYFFFTGQVLFIIIYFILRSRCSDFKVTKKKFLILAFESIVGTGVAAALLIPSAFSILDNYRVGERLYGNDLITYGDRTRIWRIVQSFFMIPDPPANPNLFNSESAKWSSIGGYLPMFSMIGVISFLKCKPDKWSSKLIKTCIVCAFIPVLNSAFYMFNASYYARWYYMPVLIMALVTVLVFERKDISPAPGIKSCIYFFTAVLLISFLPAKENMKIKWFGFAANLPFFYACLAITVAFFIVSVVLFKNKKAGKQYLKKGAIFTVIASFVCTAVLFYFGICAAPDPHIYIDAAIKGREKISLEQDDKSFYRIDTSENYDNFPMFWGFSTMRCFQSIVSPSIMEFYDSMDIDRDVASRAETSYYALRGLFSVKYYFSKLNEDGTEKKEPDLPGFTLKNEQNGFNVYENEYYVPMGFTYDYYISDENLGKTSKKFHANVLMNAIELNSEQIEKYGNLLKPTEVTFVNTLNDSTYLKSCSDRINSSSYEFTHNTGGFTAKIRTEKRNLVFFSVPYDKGFTAYVNGQKAEIEKVSNGFMAVCVPEGDNTIVFRYATHGLKPGIQVAAASILMLTVYIIIFRFYKVKSGKYSSYLQSASEEIKPDGATSSLAVDEKSIIDVDIDNDTNWP